MHRRVEAETRNVQTLFRAGNHEEALQAASELFELCTEADFQASASAPQTQHRTSSTCGQGSKYCTDLYDAP